MADDEEQPTARTSTTSHEPSEKERESGLRILEVRVRNFRCLREVNVRLGDEILLIGANGSGKTSFLEALHLAVGAGTRSVSEDDIYISPNEQAPPKDRKIVVDVLLRPTDAAGHVVGEFYEGSPWLEIWQSGIDLDDDGNDRVAIRTIAKWSAVRGEYVTERRFLGRWQEDPSKWEESKPMEKVFPVRNAQVEPIALHCIDARRDVAADLTSRSSSWQRLMSDPGISEETVESIEKSLNNINDRIVSESEVLNHVQGHLNGLYRTLSCEKGSVRITPLSRHMRDLKKGMGILLSTRAGPELPISRQGMGTRSLSSILAFRAFMTWRVAQAGDNAIHPFVSIEEPEAHLQPQAQRSLFNQLAEMPGQRIISTHSPYVCSQAPITHFRCFAKQGAETRVTELYAPGEDPGLTEEDLRKIDRQVLNTRGDILFARGLLLLEGETEEQAMPDCAKACWGQHINELGLSFISVNGSGSYLPFLRLAARFNIPWFVLADGEAKAISDLDAALEKEGEPASCDNQRVFVIPDGKNFERHIVCPPYQATLIDMIIDAEAVNDEHRKALQEQWAKEEDPLLEILAKLQANKTMYGARVGAYLASSEEGIPSLFKELFEHMGRELSISKAKEDDE